MKKIVLLSLIIFGLYKYIVITNDKWIEPSKSVCTSNGGVWLKSNICRGNWENSKMICNKMKAKLPEENELKEVLANCNRIVNSKKNEKDYTYQYCYKTKGFENNAYWSSALYPDDKDYVLIVIFKHKNIFLSTKEELHYIRCVKAEQ